VFCHFLLLLLLLLLTPSVPSRLNSRFKEVRDTFTLIAAAKALADPARIEFQAKSKFSSTQSSVSNSWARASPPVLNSGLTVLRVSISLGEGYRGRRGHRESEIITDALAAKVVIVVVIHA